MQWPVFFHTNVVGSRNYIFDIQLIYVMKGSVNFIVDDQKILLKEDDFLIVNSGQFISWHAESPVIARISIDYKMLLSYLHKDTVLFWCNSAAALGDKDNYDEFRRQIRGIIREYVMDPNRMTMMAVGLYYQMIDYMLRFFMIKTPFLYEIDIQEEDHTRYLLQNVVGYIHGHYDQKITLDQMAQLFHVNSSFLSRYFKEKMSVKFVDYVNHVRMDHIIHDLLYTQKTMTAVAFDNGFANLSLFNRNFKKVYHVTPLEFRKKMYQSPEKSKAIQDKKTQPHLEEIRHIVSEFDEASPETGKITEETYMVDVLKDGDVKSYAFDGIAVGQAQFLLSSRLQEHIRQMHRELKFKYLQVRNVLSEEMQLRQNPGECNLNFDQIDIVLDFIVENHMIPMIELGSEDLNIYKNVNEVFTVHKSKQFVMDEEDGIFVNTQFVRHLIMRYGYEEVSNWPVHLLHDSQYETDPNYHYKNTVSIIIKIWRKYLPDCKIGVWGEMIEETDGLLLEYLKQWMDDGTMPDFLLLQVKTYEKESGRNKYIPYPYYIKEQITRSRKILDDAGFQNIKLCLNHWNPIMSDRNFINDTAAKAAITVDHLLCYRKSVDILIYDYGSDLNSVYFDQNTFLTGGKGLMTRDGILKPVGYAMKFMSQMKGTLILKENGVLGIRRRSEQICFLCWYPGEFNYKYFMRSEDAWNKDEIGAVFEAGHMRRIYLTLKNMPNGSYIMKRYVIDQKNMNLIDAWNDLGGGMIQTKEEIDYMKSRSMPKMSVWYKEVWHHQMELEENIEPNVVSIIFVSKK